AMRRNGEEFPIELAITPLKTGNSFHFTAFIADISERKADETKIKRLTDLYAALNQCRQAIVRCTSEDELFPQICRAVVQFGGMKMAWIGLLDETSQRVKPVAWYGTGTDYLEGIQISVKADEPSGRGGAGTAIRENRPVWIQDFQNDPRIAPWHERGARAGWRATAALPLLRQGKVIGTFSLYAGEVNAFDEVARNLLMEMARDIGHVLDSNSLQAERKQAEEALRESEARFRSLTEMSSDFYWETDIEHRLTKRTESQREAFELVFQQAPSVGLRRWEIPYLSPDEAGWQAHHALLDAHLPFRNFEISRPRANGAVHHIAISGDPVFDAAGHFKGYRGVGTDI
ncbi:MAG: GAF domain-containing protein, partial [Bacteroidota bacterium]|nr:GAF domain-containing protein [Bacteroidota bacterium]